MRDNRLRYFQDSREAYGTVTIDSFRTDGSDQVVAVGMDYAATVVSGIGVDADPTAAVEKCIRDVIKPNGWSPAHGYPHTFSLNCLLDGSNVDPLAQDLGIAILRQPVRKMERSLVPLSQILNMMPPVERFRDQQFYCDIVQSARLANKSIHLGLGMTPEDAWLSAHGRYGLRLPPVTFVAGGPRMIRARMDAGGFVEIEGRIYADKRIPIVANWETDEVDVIVFPDDRSKIWICEINRRAFPAFRRRIEPIGPSVRATRQIRTRADVGESWPLKGVPTFFDPGDDLPKYSRSMLHSQHPLWLHQLMDAAIERYWLTPQRPSASVVFRSFQAELHRYAEQQGCVVPKVSLSTFRRKIRRLDPYTVSRYRNGFAAARRQFLARRPAVRSAR